MDIKKLFAQMPVATLKQLAMSHNVNTGIKAPSQMLKAELIKSLSDHYQSLNDTTLLPSTNYKGLNIPWADIPDIFKPKNVIKPKKITETEKDIEEMQKIDNLKQWAKDFIKIKKSPADLARERRQKLNEKFITDKQIEFAIKRRETKQAKAQAKAQEKRKAKTDSKTESKTINKEKTKTESKNESKNETNPIIDKLTSLLNRFIYLNNKEEADRDSKEYYNITLERYADILKLYNKIRNTLNEKDKEVINDLFNKIDFISENDDFNDKFQD